MTDETFKLPLIIYDSNCSLCVRFTQALQKIPGTNHIHKVSLHEEKLFEQFSSLNKEECHNVVHLILENGEILAGPKVIEYLIERFPGVSKFAWLIESEMGQKTIDYFHKAANKARQSLIKRCPTCKNGDL
jgi:predicted DCC family thiol-disulfide oxidoreductase YuxK